MDNFLQQGITAAKAGNKVEAFQLLSKAAQETTTAEQAWLWLSSVVEQDEERLFCLEYVLRINPNHPQARPAANALRQKGIFPAAPTTPFPTATQTPRAPATAEATAEPVRPSSALPTPQNAVPTSQGLTDAIYQYALVALNKNRPRYEVLKELTNRGVDHARAAELVSKAQVVVRKVHAKRHRNRMLRGLVLTVLGVGVTWGSYAAASKQGGTVFLFWGWIVYGMIDFLLGLFGWLTNR